MNVALLRQTADGVATPSYVFDTDLFRERAELVREVFGDSIGLCYSIKANPFLLCALPEVFGNIEVCSPGELTICERLGVDMSTVIFSGVNKTAADVARAMDDGVGVFTAESRLHVELIQNEAEKRGKTVPVLLRLTAGSQFGMDEDEVLDIIANRAELSAIEIVGLHYFSGTQKRKGAVIERELDYIESFLDRVRDELGFELERVEYGTGLAVDYFKPDADALERERAESISERLRSLSERCLLTVEMGRFFAAPCGYYFTRVMDVKTNKDINYAILDGGLHQIKYDGQLKGMQAPDIVHINSTEGKSENWTLCGSLCTTEDVLVREVELCGLSIGDVLVFCRTGAYSLYEGMSLFLSRELPAIYLYCEKDGLRQAREIINTDIFNTPNYKG